MRRAKKEIHAVEYYSPESPLIAHTYLDEAAKCMKRATTQLQNGRLKESVSEPIFRKFSSYLILTLNVFILILK